MSDLKNWIEAQLKRGYTRKQIKDILISKGYSPAAVAEVDKISVIKTSQKINNQKPSYPIVILLLAVALLIVIVIFIYNSYQGVKIPTTTEEIQTTTKIQTGDVQFIIDICHEFSSLENEISCENAVNKALETYPGEVYSVNKTEILPLLEGQGPAEKVWAVGINLEEPIEKELPAGSFASRAEIFISADTGTIRLLRLS